MTEIYNQKKYEQEIKSLLSPFLSIYAQLLVEAGVPSQDIERCVDAAYEYGTQGLRKAKYLQETFADIRLPMYQNSEINK